MRRWEVTERELGHMIREGLSEQLSSNLQDPGARWVTFRGREFRAGHS